MTVLSGVSVWLLKLELPSIDGKIIEWPSSEQFQVAVDSTDLDPVTKFIYLKSALKGEAASAMDGLMLTAIHYCTACELLKRCYGHRGILIIAHVQAQLGMETPQL